MGCDALRLLDPNDLDTRVLENVPAIEDGVAGAEVEPGHAGARE
jgi:hypothetical protein